jgi:ligand-binding sensor domain-containing protein/tRNA A-37 threonylcarbamoyl transferase component Bud32
MQQYIGTTLGGYRIVEQIGQGGMATVFKAYQPSVDRYVAVKVLSSHFTTDENFMARFTREARTLARLEHPHILPVHDHGEQDGTAYLVMRYCETGTLKDLISAGEPLSLQDVVRILSQVGRALDYAHSQGVIHRDIKPSNILIDPRGDVFLTDFGIAKLVVESAQFTATGGIVGTPAYMAPEQALGEPVDHRSDIYALGVVLYELVTGQVPYEAETPLAVLFKHVSEPLPLPRQVKPDLPPALERVILKAMAKSPDDRFQSAQQMIDALDRAVRSTPTEVLPAPPASEEPAPTVVRGAVTPTAPPEDAAPAVPEIAAPPRKRKPWLAIAGGAVLLAILVIAGLALLGNPAREEPTPTVSSQTAPAVSGQATPIPTLAGGVAPTTAEQPAAASVAIGAGWTSYDNSNFVYALARDDDILWAGGDGGLVRWNLADGSYAEFGRPDGLASNRIHDLLVDREGILWIATDSGVSRYDGQTFTTYGDADGLDSDWIQALFQDAGGGIWAGSHGGERGLNYYDGQRWGAAPSSFLPPLPVEYPNVTVMGGSEDVGYFVGLEDEGLLRFEGESWRLLTEADGLPAGGVLDASLTSESLWVSYEEAVVRFDLETGDMETFPEGGIYVMHQTAEGELWFGGDWRALRYDPGAGDWQEFETAPGPIPGWQVTDFAEGDGGTWLGTYGGGLAFYDGRGWEIWTTDAELGGNWIEAIRQGADGAIWFTHPGSGLSRYDPEQSTWRVFGDTEGALDWPSIPGVDSQGWLWIGDYGELLYYDGQGWQTFRSPELEEVSIYALAFGPGDVKWIVTDVGLMRHDPALDEWTTFTAADHPIFEDIWSLLVAGDGTVWLGGEEGIVRYDGSTWSAPEASGSPPVFVDDIAEAADGSLWVAADGELGHFDADRWSYFSWPSDGWLERVAVGPDGSIWTGYDGLGRFDPVDTTWQHYSPDDGLVHRIVQSILVTADGVVWVGTEGGVSRFIPPD